MASRRPICQLLKSKLQSRSSVPPVLPPRISKQDQDSGSAAMQLLRAVAFLGAGASGIMSFTTIAYADGAEHGSTGPNYPWPHLGILSSSDNASIRRGQQIYQQTCSSCHSISMVSYRDLVGVAYTEEEVKGMASEIEVIQGPNNEGEICTRPGKLNDRLPQPSTNELAAKFATGGVYPPDFNLVTKIRERLHYNPYRPNGAKVMPQMLIDGAIESEELKVVPLLLKLRR